MFKAKHHTKLGKWLFPNRSCVKALVNLQVFAGQDQKTWDARNPQNAARAHGSVTVIHSKSASRAGKTIEPNNLQYQVKNLCAPIPWTFWHLRRTKRTLNACLVHPHWSSGLLTGQIWAGSSHYWKIKVLMFKILGTPSCPLENKCKDPTTKLFEVCPVQRIGSWQKHLHLSPRKLWLALPVSLHKAGDHHRHRRLSRKHAHLLAWHRRALCTLHSTKE